MLGAALITGTARGARVLDIGSGLGSAAMDLAEAFACLVAGFDRHGPRVAQVNQTARESGVGDRVTLRNYAASAALAT